MPAIQGSQLYTNEATYTILSSLADQTTKGGISTTASKEYIFLIIGCIGGVSCFGESTPAYVVIAFLPGI